MCGVERGCAEYSNRRTAVSSRSCVKHPYPTGFKKLVLANTQDKKHEPQHQQLSREGAGRFFERPSCLAISECRD
jgi:hypothetical protein